MSDTGKLEKMTFWAFTDNTYKKQIPGLNTFTVQINPDSFSRSLSVKWAGSSTRDSKNSEGKFGGFNAEKYTFKIVFDGTGIVYGVTDIKTRIKNFLDVVYKVPAQKNSKNAERGAYVKLFYCGESFNCVVDSISINYTLFSTDGSPLRATLNCAFSSVSEAEPEKPRPNPSPTPKPQPPDDDCRPNCCEVVYVCSSDSSNMVSHAEENNYTSLHPNQSTMCTL